MVKNAQLRDLFTFSHKITVYVPGTLGVAEASDNLELIREVAAKLSEWFGGATSTKALGYWLSPAHGLVEETTTTVFAYATDAACEEHMTDVLDLCRSIKTRYQQEAVALEYDNKMFLI